ncbi:MAG: hypothetical protein FWF69_04000 [Firmicutes bacterium]|nr:hypothetical protein [Bacillota bacterium]
MKKRFAALLWLLMTLFSQAAAGEEAARMGYAQNVEAQARENGLEVRTETSFAWGGLPLLDQNLNDALESVMKTLRVAVRGHSAPGGGAVSADVYLKDVSVLDMTVLARDGVYYEQSNLLGGRTVAFTKAEFSDFSKALSERTEGALPRDFQWLFELVMLALGGGGEFGVDTAFLDSAIMVLDAWQADALSAREKLRPSVSIPGLYGSRATVVDVTREEAIALAEAFVTLVSEENALWESAVRARVKDGDENKVREVLAQVRAMLPVLPEMVGGWLPEMGDPMEYREVFGLEDEFVVKQVEAALAGDIHLLIEWIPAEKGVPSFFAGLTVGDSRATLLLTREDGMPATTGKVTRQRNRYVAECVLEDPKFALSMIMTRSENYELREEKGTLTAKTDLMFESDRLLGAGAVVTITATETDTASGVGAKYGREHVTSWTVKGLGFDGRKILTVTSNTTLEQMEERIDMEGEIVRPAQMPEEALEAWMESVQVSFMQALYTCLGRLPASAAAYALEMMR